MHHHNNSLQLHPIVVAAAEEKGKEYEQNSSQKVFPKYSFCVLKSYILVLKYIRCILQSLFKKSHAYSKMYFMLSGNFDSKNLLFQKLKKKNIPESFWKSLL